MSTQPPSNSAPHGELDPLTDRQREILEVIERTVGERGYPPSVREICTAVGLTSPSTVHTHLSSLQKMGYLRRDATKPRAIEVRFDSNSGATADRAPGPPRAARR
ncbi:MAG: helix-turn-helix domain-containing protein [Microthrixaceae bacterium]